MEGKLSRGAPRFNVTPGLVVAFDTETFYDSKAHYSLRNMTPYDYVHDPRFDAYLVAFTSEDGQRFVGAPEAFDWSSLAGAHLIAHNAAFDGMVLNRLFELGKVARFEYALDCTADMVAFFCIPRSLKDACKHLLGRTLSKKVRTEMDGKTLRDLSPVAREELIAYGGSDADNCLDLWKAKSAEWPEIEREISRANREAGWRGIRIDRANTVKGLAMLRAVKARAEAALPWVNPLDPKKAEKAGSVSALAAHAMRCGLPVPRSFNKQDPGMQAWVAKYAKDYPFIQARLDHASVTPHIARLESMVALADADDVLRFDAKYHAAHTGRSSGSGSGDETGGARFNAFNIPKGDPKTGLTFGVDMRGLLIPRPGYKYDIRDYSNVEPRITHWLAGNTEFLSRVFKENIYQAAAKTMGWYPQEGTDLKNEDKKTYQLSKACLAGETLVLTDSGYKRIVDITLTDRVWDGQAWVRHEGVICNGYRTDIVSVNGERLTSDHGVYTDASSVVRAEVLPGRGKSSAMAWRESAGAGARGDSLWALAHAVIKSLAQELRAVYRVRVHGLRRPHDPRLAQCEDGKDDALRAVRGPGVAENRGQTLVGPRPR